MNRGRLDIIASILNAAQEDILRYHILQKCKLSSKQVNEYLQLLLQSGLLDAFPAFNLRYMSGRQNKRKMIFHISRFGKRFLELYSELYALVDRSATISFRELPSLLLQKGVGVFLHKQGR